MNKDRLSYQNDQINVTEVFCGSLGQNLFLSMGYVSVIFLLLELAAVLVIKEMWCYFIWVGIPAYFFLLAADGAYIFKNKEHIGKDNVNTLYIWLFIGLTCGVSGFVTGISGLFLPCYLTFLGLLCSMGSFMTGVLLRLRIHIFCALFAACLSFVPLLFQDDLWHWQLPVTALVMVFAMVIPGHLFNHYIKKED